ncbi:MAG: GlmU family protein [Psychroflexus sp.]|nr:GlmU family protein [Psychroflexus sp.]
MNIVLFDDQLRGQFLPLTYTRPIADLRIGITKIDKKYEHLFNASVFYQTEDYLQEKFKTAPSDQETLYINSRFLPDQRLVDCVKSLSFDEVLKTETSLVAYRLKAGEALDISSKKVTTYTHENIEIKHVWDLFSYNHRAIQDDFNRITSGRESEEIPRHVYVVNPSQIFIEKGATVHNASLNASEGPIYIGKNAEVMENTAVRGPFALCESSVLKMGAKIYTGTTIGPHSKVGGEVSNSVITGYSNKGHDGFLGNSVLGEWCNIGADSNTSNLKNNYAGVKLWDYSKERFTDTGLQFCGLIMGDHSKSAINAMFNTGTIIGVSTNIFGSGFPRNFVPSFSWGGSQGVKTYNFKKAMEVAAIVMKRRQLDLTETERDILEKVYELTQAYRRD